MRSVKDLLRTYVHVNREDRAKHTVRFGSLFVLGAIGLVAFVFMTGTGPAPTDNPALLNGGADNDAQTEAAIERANEATRYETRTLPGGGAYFGYPPELFDAAYAPWYETERAAQEAMAWSINEPGMAPPVPVTREGIVIGYDVRPLDVAGLS